MTVCFLPAGAAIAMISFSLLHGARKIRDRTVGKLYLAVGGLFGLAWTAVTISFSLHTWNAAAGEVRTEKIRGCSRAAAIILFPRERSDFVRVRAIREGVDRF